MNTRRLPTRAAAEEKANNACTAERKANAAVYIGSKHPANCTAPPAKRLRVNEKNEVDITHEHTGVKSAAAQTPNRTPDPADEYLSEKGIDIANSKDTSLPIFSKNDDDDQTATTCNETPATEEKIGATKADFHPMNPSDYGKPPESSKKVMPQLQNVPFGYANFPAPPLPFHCPPGSMPPTLHMPFPVSHISPLQVQDPSKNVKNGTRLSKRNGSSASDPVTPRRASAKESEAAIAMLGCASEGNDTKPSSRLGLLNVPPTSPTSKVNNAAHSALPPLQAGISAPPFKYPPPPDQMDVNNFHCFPQVPQSGIKLSQADEYSLPPISDTFDQDDFNPDTPSSRHFSIGDVLNAANVVERTEATAVKSSKKMYDLKLSEQTQNRRNASNAGATSLSFSPGKISTFHFSKSTVKNVHSIAPEIADAAEKACILAQQALENPYIGKQLLLSMALVRTNPRSPPSSYPAHGTLLTDRFHWAQFPPLDTILRKSMKQYYELSTQKCQSKDQQDFNNSLVEQVKNEALKYGWEFDRKAFDDKKIRDRIRCFFKTHIQNAKKRLKTMLKNPSKKANIKALANHFHLIEAKHKIEPPVKWKKKEDDVMKEGEMKELDTAGRNYTNATVYSEESSDKAQIAAYSEV